MRSGYLPSALALAALMFGADAASAKGPPRAVKVYSECVLEGVREPGAESPKTYDEALDLARSHCGNLRPAAVAAVHKSFGKRLTVGGDDPDVAAQAFLDIMIEEQAAEIWARQHPEDQSHAR